MTRRIQLLESGNRQSSRRVAVIARRIREDLLRHNKVVPAVLGVLALLVFAWLAAGALTGGGSDQEETSSQASLAQAPGDSTSGSPETPAPGGENRDTDSYSAFQSKDPFRDIVPNNGGPTSGPSSGPTSESTSESTTGRGGESGGGGSRGGANGSGRGGGESTTGQSSPGGGSSEGGGSARGGTRGGTGQTGGAGQGAGAGQGGGLFNSGGDLAPPP